MNYKPEDTARQSSSEEEEEEEEDVGGPAADAPQHQEELPDLPDPGAGPSAPPAAKRRSTQKKPLAE